MDISDEDRWKQGKTVLIHHDFNIQLVLVNIETVKWSKIFMTCSVTPVSVK